MTAKFISFVLIKLVIMIFQAEICAEDNGDSIGLIRFMAADSMFPAKKKMVFQPRRV